MPMGQRKVGMGFAKAMRLAARDSFKKKQAKNEAKAKRKAEQSGEGDRGASDDSPPGPTDPGGDRPTYPGDFTGRPRIVYEPHPDGVADPGEIVWLWSPSKRTTASQGKDRPVLVIARDGAWLLALQLTSKDHDRDAEQERAARRRWMDIGAGLWDRDGRPSEVRLNRLIRVDPEAVRREGATLDESRFDQVADAVRATLP